MTIKTVHTLRARVDVLLRSFGQGHGCRICIHVVLALVMALGVGLSLATSNIVADVQKASTLLYERDEPRLEHLDMFLNGLSEYKAALVGLAVIRADAAHVREAAEAPLRKMHGHWHGILEAADSPDEQAQLERGFVQLESAGAALQEADVMARSDAEVRRRLLDLNTQADALHRLVGSIHRRSEAGATRTGHVAAQRTATIATLVRLYIGFALISAVILFYHVRARIKSQDALNYLARHDEMTRLPNRWAFLERLEMLARSRTAPKGGAAGKDIAVAPGLLVLEAERFDRVVAGIGHLGADDLVREIARRIADLGNAIGADAYRLGDSKFGLLLPNGVDVGSTAARLQACMALPIMAGRHEIVLPTTIGSALIPAAPQGAAAAVQQAETALHLARRQKTAYVAYSMQLADLVQENLALETELRHAVERGEFELHYQPQQRLSDGALVGFEALLRWKRAAGPVSPAQFIPLAEESGLVVTLGEWVIGEACRQAAAWQVGGLPAPTVAINISPHQFAQPRFAERLRQHLVATGVDPGGIEVEITEGVLMDHASSTDQLLADIRSLGVKLAIDDFGTGYSSLAYLKRFPVQKLKIDQAFVRQLEASGDDAEIVKAVIGLGHNMGFTVIAEGVETAQQAYLLAGWGCDQIQGYHYGRPLPATQAAAFIEQAVQMRLVA